MEVEFLDGDLIRGEKTNREAGAAGGVEDVDAAADAFDDAGEIERAAFEELRPGVAVDDFVSHRLEGVCGQRFASGAEVGGDAEGGGKAGFEMDVAGAMFARRSDKVVECGHRWAELTPLRRKCSSRG